MGSLQHAVVFASGLLDLLYGVFSQIKSYGIALESHHICASTLKSSLHVAAPLDGLGKAASRENTKFPIRLLFHAGFLPVVLICHFTWSILIGCLRRSASYNQLTQLLFCTNI